MTQSEIDFVQNILDDIMDNSPIDDFDGFEIGFTRALIELDNVREKRYFRACSVDDFIKKMQIAAKSLNHIADKLKEANNAS